MQPIVQPQTLRFESDGRAFPNHPTLPALVYPQVFDTKTKSIASKFEKQRQTKILQANPIYGPHGSLAKLWSPKERDTSLLIKKAYQNKSHGERRSLPKGPKPLSS